jgi:hypothetical protein
MNTARGVGFVGPMEVGDPAEEIVSVKSRGATSAPNIAEGVGIPVGDPTSRQSSPPS